MEVKGFTRLIPGIQSPGNGTISVVMEIEGFPHDMLVDTGAEVTLIRSAIPRVSLCPADIQARGVTGQPLRIEGTQLLKCKLRGKEFTHPIIISPLDLPGDGIIGLDVLDKIRARVLVKERRLEIEEESAVRRMEKHSEQIKKVCLATKALEQKWGSMPKQTKREVEADSMRAVRLRARNIRKRKKRRAERRLARRKEYEVEETRRQEPVREGDEPLLVTSISPVRIPPYSEALVRGQVTGEEHSTVLIEPIGVRQVGVRVARCLSEIQKGGVWLKVVNLCPQDIILDRNQALGVAATWKVRSEFGSQEKGVSQSTREGKVAVGLRAIGRTSPGWDLSHLNATETAVIEPLLQRYEELFQPPGAEGCTVGVKHQIPTGDARPIMKRPYRVPFHHRPVIENHLKEMLDKGVIAHSNSPWAAPVVLVPKKSEDGTVNYRFCTDFRGLNALTQVDAYPLPLIQETLELLGRSKIFSTLDLSSGYHQIPVAEEDQPKTAFTTLDGHYEYKKMPFGLAGAPATFQRTMDQILTGIKGIECYVYLDDIIIFSVSLEQHRDRLQHVFERLKAANLKLNGAKCKFAVRQVKYLGHLVTAEGVRPDEDKIHAVMEFPVPSTAKEVRGFLGLAGYYRRFVPRFAEKAKPLTLLTGKDRKFQWGTEQEEAFRELKEALCTEPVLIYPDFKDQFILATDASGVAVGAVLSQVRNGHERPVAYASRQLHQAEQNYSATERELLSVIWATKHFRCYLLGRRFTLVTDHSALRWMLSLRDPSSRLTRWALRLEEFEYEVIHKPGRRHTNADALSRAVAKVATGKAQVSEKYRQYQMEDEECVKWAEQNPRVCKQDDEGLLYWGEGKNPQQWKVVVPQPLRKEVLEECHSSIWAGHPGIERTFSIIKQKYFWPSMKDDVETFVKACHSCATRKTPAGLTVPVERPFFPTQPFEMVSLDIVGPFPRSGRGNKYLLTFIDHLTRYTEAIAIPEQTAEATAKAFVEKIITRHGVPHRLLTDQGRNFVSGLFKDVCKTLGITKLQTTPYHPQSNGMLERFHRTLGDSLAHFAKKDGRDWDRWIPYALMAYRAIPHSATGFSPNYLLFGRELRTPSYLETLRTGEGTEGTGDACQQIRDRVHEAREEALLRIDREWARRTERINRTRRERNFDVGDLVYLHVPAVRPGHFPKFHCPWTGPHVVVKKLGRVTYEIRNETGNNQVVHINRLKPAYGNKIRESQVELHEGNDRVSKESLLEDQGHGHGGSESEEEEDGLDIVPMGSSDEEDEGDENDPEAMLQPATLATSSPKGSTMTPWEAVETAGRPSLIPQSQAPSTPTQEPAVVDAEDSEASNVALPEDPKDETWEPDSFSNVPISRSPYYLRRPRD